MACPARFVLGLSRFVGATTGRRKCRSLATSPSPIVLIARSIQIDRDEAIFFNVSNDRYCEEVIARKKFGCRDAARALTEIRDDVPVDISDDVKVDEAAPASKHLHHKLQDSGIAADQDGHSVIRAQLVKLGLNLWRQPLCTDSVLHRPLFKATLFKLRHPNNRVRQI